MPLAPTCSEFGLIDLFRRAAGPPRQPWVRTGIGDDCAVLQPAPGQQLLVSTDLLVEGVHFLAAASDPVRLGYKALAVNLSDIAAMGGEARGVLLGLGLPRPPDQTFVRGLRDGLLACASEHGVDLLGGDTVASPGGLLLCLTVLGQVPEGQAVLRSGARPGERILLGGPVGDSAAGLQLLLHGEPRDAAGEPRLTREERDALLTAHTRPRPQLALGRCLARHHLATAMIDVSDGLLQDLGHLCEESGVGAELDARALPLSSAARRLAATLDRDPLDWALGGGEDYVLLCCVPAGRESEALDLCEKEAGCRPVPVGTITAGSGLRLGQDGSWQEVAARGFDHFGG